MYDFMISVLMFTFLFWCLVFAVGALHKLINLRRKK